MNIWRDDADINNNLFFLNLITYFYLFTFVSQSWMAFFIYNHFKICSIKLLMFRYSIGKECADLIFLIGISCDNDLIDSIGYWA